MTDRCVWKFFIAIEDDQLIEMPAGAELLTVAVQDSGIAIWARVTPGAPRVQRHLLVRGTGHPVGDEPYVGTVPWPGNLIWHVFDGGEK